MRQCFKRDAEGEWTEINFKDLQAGDVFTLFDNGNVVTDEELNMEFKATSSAYLGPSGNYTILYEVEK